MRRLRADRDDDAMPPIHPELVDYDALVFSHIHAVSPRPSGCVKIAGTGSAGSHDPPRAGPRLARRQCVGLVGWGLVRKPAPRVHPNPRAYYGDDGRLFLRRVAESLREANGDRRLEDREVEDMLREPRLGAIAHRLYRIMNGAEKRKFRHRLTQYTLSNDEVRGLADLLPDAPPPPSIPVDRAPSDQRREGRRDRRARTIAGWCGD